MIIQGNEVKNDGEKIVLKSLHVTNLNAVIQKA